MSVRGRLLLAASGLLCVTLCQAAPDFAGAPASEDARFAAEQVLGANDHRGLPFAIVDKRDARIYVFEPSGRLVGASAVLLGATLGDRVVADAALRIPGRPTLDERTTPAGRFAIRSRDGTTRARRSSGSTTRHRSRSTACAPRRPPSDARSDSRRRRPTTTGSRSAASSFRSSSTNRSSRRAWAAAAASSTCCPSRDRRGRCSTRRWWLAQPPTERALHWRR